MRLLIHKYSGSQLLKFLFVGVLNTIFGYSLFAFFIYIGVIYPLAVLFGTVLGVLFNFKTIGSLVFGHKGYSKLMHFISVYTLIYILNVFGLWFFEQVGLENKYIAGAILLFPLAIVSFVLNKKFVFN